MLGGDGLDGAVVVEGEVIGAGETGARSVAEVIDCDRSVFEEAEEFIDDTGGEAATVFPAGEAFLTALEEGRELVLTEAELKAESLDIGSMQEAHVAGAGALDELARLGGEHGFAAALVDFHLNGFDEFRSFLRRAGEVDIKVNGFGLGFWTHFFDLK
jgi:hypothetical protein